MTRAQRIPDQAFPCLCLSRQDPIWFRDRGRPIRSHRTYNHHRTRRYRPTRGRLNFRLKIRLSALPRRQPGDLAQWEWRPPFPRGLSKGDDMSGDVDRTENPSGVSDSRVPAWLELSFIVMAGCAGFTLLAYLLWLWTS